MKRKYLLAVGIKFLISAVVIAIVIAFNLLVFKSVSMIAIAAMGIVLSIFNVIELRTEFRKIKETCTANSNNSKN